MSQVPAALRSTPWHPQPGQDWLRPPFLNHSIPQHCQTEGGCSLLLPSFEELDVRSFTPLLSGRARDIPDNKENHVGIPRTTAWSLCEGTSHGIPQRPRQGRRRKPGRDQNDLSLPRLTSGRQDRGPQRVRLKEALDGREVNLGGRCRSPPV